MFIIAQTVIMCHCHSEVKAIRVCLKTADHCRLPQITTDHRGLILTENDGLLWDEWSVVLWFYYRCNSDLRINVKLCFRATRQELSEVLDLQKMLICGQLEWCAFHTSSLWSYKRQQWSGT